MSSSSSKADSELNYEGLRFYNEEFSLDKARKEMGGKYISKWSLGILLGFIIFSMLFIIGCIIVRVLMRDEGSYYKSPERKTKFIEKDETWYIPDNIDDNGRVFLTMTGAGGGGCNGGATISGGGGNSGVSIVNYPIILDKKYKCRFSMGMGGDMNQEGSPSEIYCFDRNGILQINMQLQGGRSGCGPLPSDRRGSNIYPYTHELFGARTENGTLAQSHPYGGIGGKGNNGGAGSVFGSGGTNKEYTVDDDDDYPAHGAGGFGGLSGFGAPSRGGNGKAFIMYYTK